MRIPRTKAELAAAKNHLGKKSGFLWGTVDVSKMPEYPLIFVVWNWKREGYMDFEAGGFGRQFYFTRTPKWDE